MYFALVLRLERLRHIYGMKVHIKRLLYWAGICVIAGLAAIPTFAQERAILTLTPLTLSIGETASIEAYADCGSAICSTFDIQIEYDPTLLSVDRVELGRYLGDSAIVLQNSYEQAGTIRLSAVALGATQPQADDPLFIITVTGIAPGQTPLTTSNLTIGDTASLVASVHGGVVQIVLAESLPTTTLAPITCPGTLPSRLTPGGLAEVTPGDPNNLRDAPSTTSNRIGQILAGDPFLVIEGPECRDGYAWWQINYRGRVGWTVESDSDSYWVAPLAESGSADQVSDLVTFTAFNSNLGGWLPEGDGGSWSFTDSGLMGTVQRGTDSFYVTGDSYADFNYETTFTMTEGTTTAAAGVVFRSQPDPLDGCYMVRISIYNGGEISLVKFYPVRRYQQLGRSNIPIGLNAPYTIRVVAVGAQMNIYLNGQLVLQSSDGSYSQGAVGLNVNSSTTIFTEAYAQSS